LIWPSGTLRTSRAVESAVGKRSKCKKIDGLPIKRREEKGTSPLNTGKKTGKDWNQVQRNRCGRRNRAKEKRRALGKKVWGGKEEFLFLLTGGRGRLPRTTPSSETPRTLSEGGGGEKPNLTNPDSERQLGEEKSRGNVSNIKL